MAKKKFSLTDQIKEQIINTLILLYSITALPLLILSFVRIQITGWTLNYSLQIFFVVIFWVFFIFRKKFGYKFKAVFTSIVLLLLCVSGIHHLGVLSTGLIFLLLFSVFVTLFLGKTPGYVGLIIISTIMAIYGYLYISGRFSYDYDIRQMIDEGRLWYAKGFAILVATYSIVLIISRFESAYDKLLAQSIQRESEYRLLFEQSNEGIIISDMVGKVLMVNERFREMSGYEHKDIVGKNFMEFLVAEDLEDNPIRFDLLQKGETVESLRRSIDKNGNIRLLEARASILPDGRLQTFLRDITDQRKYEEEIEEVRAFGKKMIEAMPGVFYVFENYEKLVQWNESLQEISGYTEDELKKIHPNDLFGEGGSEYDDAKMYEFEKEDSAYFRASLITKSGQSIPLYNSAINYEMNGKLYLMGMGHDITGLVEAEKALINSEENFKNIYNNTSDAIFIFNYNFKILSANETFLNLTGFKREELSEVNIFDYIFDHNALSKVAGEIDQLNKGRVVVAEYMIHNNEGKYFPVEIRSRRITYEGEPAVVTAFNDISARKNLEKQVYTVSLKAEEDERGRIAKDLHDGLGPLLSTCKIYLHNLKNSTFTDKEIISFTKLSELINESLIGVKEISNNLSPHILRNFGLVHALESFIEKLSAYSEINIHHNFNVQRRYDEVTEITLYRVVTELMNNTLKHSNADNLSVSVFEENSKLIVNYADDGRGFDFEETMNKDKGFGLFNINSRIKSIGGVIKFNSSAGKGVSVKIETNISHG